MDAEEQEERHAERSGPRLLALLIGLAAIGVLAGTLVAAGLYGALAVASFVREAAADFLHGF
ncbi:hypothetical protein [Kitasatospora sp. NPDC090091]|uniref:hypothetical protein n=1 Tax=Kitasatospora sp. NPDC090091 TaxID=3364081 RepID=UPI00380C87D0